MGETRYIISDASKMVDVESHVLRYWEDELGIQIPRNEMGHRYYTDFYIDLFKRIKELKDRGIQLKAIKMLIPELVNMDKDNMDSMKFIKEELFDETKNDVQVDELITDKKEENISDTVNRITNDGENTDIATIKSEQNLGKLDKLSKVEQFQMIINEVVSNALKENTESLGKGVSEIVSDNVIKEMDYLMHIREKQEEERFMKLDETIRNYQSSRKENAKKSQGKTLFTKLKRL